MLGWDHDPEGFVFMAHFQVLEILDSGWKDAEEPETHQPYLQREHQWW